MPKSGMIAKALVCVAAAALAYLTFSVTLANAAAARAPPLAARLWPGHAVANARLADGILTADPKRPKIDEAARHALKALRRNPTLPAPSRILALREAMRNRETQAARLFDYSALMSKRDLPTQFWMIERRVAAEDVYGALAHFRIALQVAPTTQSVLFPVLTGAIEDPQLVKPIAELVKVGTSWNLWFLHHVAENARDGATAVNFYRTLAQMGSPPEKGHFEALLARLTKTGDLTAAARLYPLVDRGWKSADLNAQLNGSFERSSELPPFGWTLNPDIAWMGPKQDGSGKALHIIVPDEGEEWAARRQLVYPAGRYRLSGNFAVSEGQRVGRLNFMLSCKAEDDIAAAMPIAADRGTFSAIIVAPAACPGPWLNLSIGGDARSSGSVLWIDDLQVAPAQ